MSLIFQRCGSTFSATSFQNPHTFTTVLPVSRQLRVLEVQVDPEDPVRQSCLVLIHLAFCSPQVRFRPRLAGTGRIRPAEGEEWTGVPLICWVKWGRQPQQART